MANLTINDFNFLTAHYLYPMVIHCSKKWENKNKYRDIQKIIQTKKDQFLKEETKVIEKISILDILNQIFNQVPLIYELQSETNFVSSGWKTTKEYIKNGSWKWLLFITDSFMEIFWLLVEQIAVKQHLLKSWV